MLAAYIIIGVISYTVAGILSAGFAMRTVKGDDYKENYDYIMAGLVGLVWPAYAIFAALLGGFYLLGRGGTALVSALDKIRRV